MRRTLEIAAFVMLLAMWAETAYAVFGPGAVPERIPAHFGASGQPDAWGSRSMLWMPPAIAVGIYLLFGLVSRHPSAYHFPMQVTPAARRRLEAVALNLVLWLKTEVVCLFAWIQHQTLDFLRYGRRGLTTALVPLALVVIFGTITWHVAAMRRLGRAS